MKQQSVTPSNPPLITIGVTAFNAAETIARALDSAIGQTWRPLEIVVVDDFSDDATPNVLENYASQHQCLRYYRQDQNRGVAAARNRLIEEARGEFIAFFDDDDVSEPERLSSQISRLIDYEQRFAEGAMVICHAARTQIYPDGTTRTEPTMGQREGRPAPAGTAVARRILLGAPLEDGYGSCATCSQFGRTETYKSLDGFDARFRRCEDTDLTIRLALAGAHFPGIGRPLVKQKMTLSQEKSLEEECHYMLLLLDKHADFLKAAGQFEFAVEWAKLKYLWLEGRHREFATGLSALAFTHPQSTARRLIMALPNLHLNATFGRFYRRARSS